MFFGWIPRFRGDDDVDYFHPPRREAPRFAGLVEEDDVAVGIAKPGFAPHPGLVARAMLERDAAARQLLDPLVEIVAFEIDRGRRDDLLLGVDLDREGRAARVSNRA